MEKSRRDVLKLMGAAAGSALLAACSTNSVSDELGPQSSGTYQRFYVDSDGGNDDNSGTDTKESVKTLQRALDLSHEYDAVPKILLRAGGTYSIGVISKYGSEDTPMTIDRWDKDKGDTPVISGAATMRDWEGVSGRPNIYKKVTQEPAHALYIDGEDAPISVYESSWLTILDYDEGSATITLKDVSVDSSMIGARVRVRVTKFAEQADRTVKALRGESGLVLDKPLDKPLGYFDEKRGQYPQQLKLENGKGDAFFKEDNNWCCVKEGDEYVTYLYSSDPNNKDIKRALHLDLLTLEGTPEYLHINNVRFIAAGRNAITSKASVRNIRIGNGCSFSRITKAGIYFYGKGNAEDVVIGENVSNSKDVDSYMQFDRCGIMVLVNRPKNPKIQFLAGRDIGLTGAVFNDKENAGVFSQLNGAIVTTGYLSRSPEDNIVGGSIHHINLTNVGGNGVAHNGFKTEIYEIKGDKINQRLDDIALVYCWSRADKRGVRRTEDVKIYNVTAKNSSDVYEGWNNSESAERLRVGVYLDNGVNGSTVENVTVKNCFKGILVNYFTENNTVRNNTLTNCQQSIVVHERPSVGENLNTGHVITDNRVKLTRDNQYAFIFWQSKSLAESQVTFGTWGNNTIEAATDEQKTVLFRYNKNPNFGKDRPESESTFYTLAEFEAAQCGEALTCS